MDRRFYKRILIGTMSNFVIKDSELGCSEFDGLIEDISEDGIKICINNMNYSSIVDGIKTGDRILFQSVDEYTLYSDLHTDVFSGEATVVRIEKKDESIIIGCKVSKASEEYDEYVKNKKMALYMNSLQITKI